jgi:hypothetical protein
LHSGCTAGCTAGGAARNVLGRPRVLVRNHPMPSAVIPSPKTGRALVDEYFIENRTRVLDVAAFLDRLDRASDGPPASDFRVRLFREALAVLAGDGAADGPGRVERIQLLFSDPTTEPLERLDQKSARGAYDRWQAEGV